MKRARFFNCVVLGRILAIAVAAMTGENAVSQVANQPGPVAANSQVAPNDLRAPVRETPEKLVAAIQQASLWQHLTDFQTIADQHPGRDGHGNRDTGTSGYKAYGRDHEINIAGKPTLLASSDPHYRGDPSRHNPEDLLLAAISGCHLLWYLHFCSDSQIIVVSYQDEAEATMEVAADGNGRFTKAVLRPQVTITSTEKIPLAEHLHEKAHKFCFIANSVNFPITVEPRVEIRHG